MDKSLIAALLLLPQLVLAQTHTMPGSNVVPAGASLTIQSGATITAAVGSTVSGFGAGGGGGGTVTSITATTPIIVTPSPLVGVGIVSLDGTTKNNWDTAYTDRLKWDGGSTGLVAATGRTSLGLVIGTNVQAYDADLTTWAGVTPTSGIQTWLATPSSANLRAAVTDENGSGALLFNGATTPDFTTGITIGGVGTSGKILKGDGTRYAPSTETYAAPGTSGNVMTSNGTNWTSAAPASPTKVLWLTSGTTYTPSAGIRALYVECLGGGGGGGGAKAAASASAVAGGGGSGSVNAAWITGAGIKASYSYALGAGGTGGANTGGNGGAGGATTFDSPSVCTGNGGSGAIGISSTATPAFALGGTSGSNSGVGNTYLRGNPGLAAINLSSTVVKAGDGADSMFGGRIPGGGGGGAGGTNPSPGGGGAGASSVSATGFTGGDGGDGAIRVTEFF